MPMILLVEFFKAEEEDKTRVSSFGSSRTHNELLQNTNDTGFAKLTVLRTIGTEKEEEKGGNGRKENRERS
jgi:hypothetical protein